MRIISANQIFVVQYSLNILLVDLPYHIIIHYLLRWYLSFKYSHLAVTNLAFYSL